MVMMVCSNPGYSEEICMWGAAKLKFKHGGGGGGDVKMGLGPKIMGGYGAKLWGDQQPP